MDKIVPRNSMVLGSGFFVFGRGKEMDDDSTTTMTSTLDDDDDAADSELAGLLQQRVRATCFLPSMARFSGPRARRSHGSLIFFPSIVKGGSDTVEKVVEKIKCYSISG